MRLSEALKDKKFDIRVHDKMLAEGKLTNDEIRKYLAALPDDTNSVAYTEEPTVEETPQ